MKLTSEQLAEFHERGYVFLPDCFSDEEVAVLRSEAKEFYRSDRKEVPLMIIPKSHKHGILDAGHDLETNSYPLWTLDKQDITRLAE